VQGIIIGFFRTYYLWLISLFFNLFLPSAVGGDIAKAYYIYKDTHKKLAAVSSVLVDRFMGLMATISIGTGAFLLARDQINNPKIGSFLLLFVVITIVGTLFFMSKRFARPAKQLFVKMFPHRFQHKLQNFFEAVELYRDHRRCLVLAFVYSVAAQGCFITVYYFLALSLNISVPYVIFFLLIPLVNICSMVPSVGGLGVREASTVYLFSNYMLMEQAVALSLIGGVLIYGVGVLCGILYAIRGGASIQEMEKIEEENGVA
jgi:glycosyltransferase 2 family protein